MRSKKAITPVIAVILLIVMTVGIAAFTFIWMQNFVQNLQTQTQQQVHQLQRPRFTISYAAYDGSNLKFVLANAGTVPINTEELKVTVEQYDKVSESFEKAVIINGKPTCNPKQVSPNGDTNCEIKAPRLDLKNKYYVIIATYKGVTAQNTLRK